MLHRINPLDATCQEIFDHILAFQRQVLAFACNPATSLPLTETDIQDEFGLAADWFWRQLHGQRGRSRGEPNDLYRALESLIEFVQAHPGSGETILEAFDHDISFPDHIDDPDFQFSYKTVFDNATRDAIKPLMVAFYEKLLYSGFPEQIHLRHGNSTRFDRDAFVRSFWAANPDLNVCPACDGQRPDSIRDKNYSDADHYLPKAAYSFLSIHPANLVPVCKNCNSSFKGTHDPIDVAGDAPLVNVFMPYYRPALDFIKVQAYRTDVGELQFRIFDSDDSRSRRVDNLDQTFQLEDRWRSRTDQVTGSIREALSNARRIMLRHKNNPDQIELRTELGEMLQERTRRIGKNYNYVLHASYLRFAKTDQGEFEELLRQFEGE